MPVRGVRESLILCRSKKSTAQVGELAILQNYKGRKEAAPGIIWARLSTLQTPNFFLWKTLWKLCKLLFKVFYPQKRL